MLSFIFKHFILHPGKKSSLHKIMVYLCGGVTSTSGWRNGVPCRFSSTVMDWHFFLGINPRALTLSLFLATCLWCGHALAVRATTGSHLGTSFTRRTGSAWSQIESGLSPHLSLHSWDSWWTEEEDAMCTWGAYNYLTLCSETVQTTYSPGTNTKGCSSSDTVRTREDKHLS